MQSSTNGAAAAAAGDLSQQQQQQQWMAMQYQQQQWMAMHYPQQMMYQQPHYMQPYAYQQQQQQNQAQIQSSGEDNKTIWIGDLQHWMDESYLQSVFAHTGEVINVKLIRNKQTGQSERFGFIEFVSHAAAEKNLLTYNGTVMPNTDQTFRLNWGTFSSGERRPDSGSDPSIFVGDLAADVTDGILHETFASRYPSVKGAKVVFDSNTGRSKGYGFVRFGDENERSKAMTEMNGVYCSSRPMRISVATPKKASSAPHDSSSQAVILAGGYSANGAMQQTPQSDGDLSNTTVFVGGIDSEVTDEDLRQAFAEFGEIISTKIPAGKGCGFVQFAARSSAEEAIQQMNGSVIGKQTVRLSWGRNPGNKQWRTDSNQWNGNYRGGNGGGGYGYAVAQNQDPGMYGDGSNGYVNQ